MRLITIAALSCTVVVAACARAETASASAAPVAANAAPAPAATSDAAPGTAAAAPAPAPEAAAAGAKVREITIPAGTILPVTLDTTVGSDTSRVEQAVQGHLSRALVINGRTVLPSGSRVAGVVTDATRPGKVKGRSHVSVRFESLTPSNSDERYRIHTASVGRTGVATKKEDALKIGAPAAGGAIVGAIVGGKKGAAIGTAAGGGAGTAVVLSTRGKDVRMLRGTGLRVRLSEPITIRVRG